MHTGIETTTWRYLTALCCPGLSCPALTFYHDVVTVQVYHTCDFVLLERERVSYSLPGIIKVAEAVSGSVSTSAR
jgi:hypothetical protein